MVTFQVVSDDARVEAKRRLSLLQQLREGRTVFVPDATSRHFGGHRTAAKANGKTMHSRQTVHEGQSGVIVWWE